MYLAGSAPVFHSYKQEDAQTEERIAQILTEAQAAMTVKQHHEQVGINVGAHNIMSSGLKIFLKISFELSIYSQNI